MKSDATFLVLLATLGLLTWWPAAKMGAIEEGYAERLKDWEKRHGHKVDRGRV